MEGPIKKRKHTYVSQNKIVFDLVFPWLFYGHYTDRILAFRTLLALTGTCRQLRYFQLLRRYVAYLVPACVRERFREHGFAVAAPIERWVDLLQNQLLGTGHVYYLFQDTPFVVPPFESNFFGVSFFNMAKKKGPDQTVAIVCMPATFAELALFCYCIVQADDSDLKGIDACEVLPQWKHKEDDIIRIPVKLRQNFGGRFLLAKLMRVGTTAPVDPEFARGSLTESAYSLFAKTCNTNGRKDKQKPIQRLKSFVQAWFPMTRISVGPEDKKSRAYDFKMQFEN